MRILQISTYDIRGGAARATHRLHRGLRELGEDCRMLVRHKDSNDHSISCIIPENPAEKVEEEFFLSVAIQQHYIDSHRTDISNTLFSLPYPGYDLSALPMVQAADIINLHWVARYQSPLTLHKLFALGKPVVWTLHDQWAFTGGCHYTAGCEEYRQDCATCPQLADDPFGVPGAVLKDKLKFFKDANLTIVTPSRWMAECARQSRLFKDLRVEVIPNSLETDVFSPQSKSEAKESIGITAETITLLFGGEDSNERRKGFRELKAAIKYCLKDARFENLVKSDKIRMICFGRPYDDLNTVGMPVVPLDYLDSDEKISAAYCAADIFVLPSLEDNLPNTMLEAMSCGTPLVAFDVGGMPDAVINGVTGQLVPLCDTRQMGKAILSLIFNSEKRGVMGKKCREKIEEKYKLEIQAQRYLDLYQELFEPYASTPQATFEDQTARAWEVPVSLKGEPLSVTLEPGVDSHFKDIYDKVLFKALKELSCYVQKQWQASEADRAERLKVIEQLGEKLEAFESDRVAFESDRVASELDRVASELDRVALVELIQAHEKIFTGSLVGLLRYRRATKKSMNTQRKNDVSPRQCADPQRLGVFTAEAKGAKEDESFAVSGPGASASQEIRDMSMKASGEKFPLISIVVPSFNQGRFLREALDSIFRQNYPHLEVIVMDGGSTDESVDIIKKYAGNVTYWISEPDEGQSHAINKGFDNSTGDVVAWLNSDDFYLPGAFEAIARAYQENPAASFYFGDGWRVDEDGRSKAGFFPDHHVCFNRIGLIFGLNYILQPATFINRNYLSKAGLLNPSLRYGMDTDLWIRLSGITPPEPVSAFLAASREYGVTKTAKGSFERVEELRRIAQDYSALSMTPGTMCYFLDTFHRVVSDREDVYPKSFKRQVEIFWGETAKLMSNFGCRTDGFPMLSKTHGEKDKQ